MIDLSGFMPVELTEQLRFILDLGGAIVAALIGGAIAVRLRQPAVVGYMLAGVLIGPFTPGFVGGQEQIAILAEVGVVLLLFALGVEFSIRELRSVGRVVIPGGIAQVLLTLGAGMFVMVLLGTDLRESLIVGACLSLSSTIVVLKQLIDRGEMDSAHGRAAVGWSIVQDIATIVFIVALPPLAGGDVIVPFAAAMVKAAVFLALAYVVGTRLLPWMFATVARLGSPELFLLAVVATALMTAFISSAFFGLSLALGAFVAGVLVSESELSHQAAAEVTPFRDLFAVLFFVSVGMLVDPAALVADAPIVLVLVIVAVVVKGVSIAVLGRALGLPMRSAILLGAIMAQVGEFSLILAENGRHLDLLDARTYNIVLGTAVVTIILSPFVTRLGDRLVHARSPESWSGSPATPASRLGRRAWPRAPPAPSRRSPPTRRRADRGSSSWGRVGSGGSWSPPRAPVGSGASSWIATRDASRRSSASGPPRCSATRRTRRSSSASAWTGLVCSSSRSAIP